ncbi:hypothetical protein BpsM61_00075 [Bacillus phage vB_BpsM-61]|nr:hypothetical protein BpsM61_00075 [Bacillus phage vB_BpsM-61]
MHKPHDPYPIVYCLKEGQSLKDGEIIREEIGGKTLKMKILSILKLEPKINGMDVHCLVREIPEKGK